MKLTKEEKQGVKMVIALQAFAGITESKPKALTGWRAMTEQEKQHTKKVFNLVKP